MTAWRWACLVLILMLTGRCLADPSPLAPARASCVKAVGECVEKPEVARQDLLRASQSLTDMEGAEAAQEALEHAAAVSPGERLEAARQALRTLDSLDRAMYSPGYSEADREGQKKTLHQILLRSEFNQHDNQAMRELRRLAARVLEWLSNLSLAPMRGSLGYVVIVFILCCLALALGWAVARMLLVRLDNNPKGAPKPQKERRIMLPPDADALLADAAAQHAQGNLREAMHMGFQALLVRVHRRAELPYDEALTDREMRARLNKAGFETLATRTGEAARTFEPCWYGGRVATAEDYSTLVALVPPEGKERP